MTPILPIPVKQRRDTIIGALQDFSHGGELAREAVTAQLRWSVQMLDSRCPEAIRGELQWQTWLM